MHENRILPPHLRQMGSLPRGCGVDSGSMNLCLQKLYQGSMAGWFTPILIQELSGLSEGGNDRSGRARLDPRFTGSAGSRWRAAMKEAAN